MSRPMEAPAQSRQAYVGLREVDKAFDGLSRAVQDGSVRILKVPMVWDALRSDPRFVTLSRKAAGYGK